MKTFRSITVLAILTMTISVHSQTIIRNFDSAGDLAANFSLVGTNKFSEADTIGLGSSRALEVGDVFVQGSYVHNSGIASGYTSVSTSIFFQWLTPTNVGGGAGLFLGFGPDTSYSPPIGGGGAATNDHALLALASNGLLFVQNVADGGSPQNAGFAATSLTSGNWYQAKLDLTPTGGNDFDLTATITNSDSSGVLGSIVQTASSSFTNASLITDSEIHAFFGGQGGSVSRGIDTVDNFSTVVIPEPSTFTMIGLALASLYILRRRQ